MSSALHPLLDLITALPRVEDPWPASVGLDMPFSAAGFGGVLGSVIAADRSPDEQARAMSRWGRRFFWLGALSYLFLFVNQLLSTR